MATTSFVGGRLRVTHSDAYRASTSRTRSIDLATAGDVDALLVDTLRRNGFDAVHRVVVGPDRAKSRDVGAGQGTSVSLALDVATDEDAVVLLEHEGCYTWLRPRHETSRDPQVIGRVAVFEFVVPPAGAATRDLGGLPAGAARATVLSYASPLLSKAAIRALELFVDPGLVHIAGVDPAEWRHVGSLADTGLSPDRNSRVLLLRPRDLRLDSGRVRCARRHRSGTRLPDPGARRLRRRHRLRPQDAERRPARERPRARCRADAVPGATGDVGRGLPQPRRAHRTQLRRVRSSGSRLARQGGPGGLRGRHQRGHPLRGRDPLGRSGRRLHQPRGRQRAGDRRAAGRSTDRGPRRRRGPRHRRAGPMAGLVRDRPRQRPRYRRDGAGRALRHRDQPGPAWPAPFGDALVRRVVGLRGDRRRPPTGAPGGRGRAARRRCGRPGHHRAERPRRRRRVDERHRPRARRRVRAQRPCPAGELDRLPHELLLPGVRLPGSGGVARPAGRPPRGGGAGGSGPGHRR